MKIGPAPNRSDVAVLPNAEPSIAAIAAKPGSHVPELDGIRALAIWGVLVAHLIYAEPVSDRGRAFIPPAISVVLNHLWLGVDLFFVLSGFLITGILLKTKELPRGEFFRRFYTRRALRIWPLYFIILTGLCVAYGAHYAGYFVLCILFIANMAPAAMAVPDGAGPFWSLSVEEQFYLVWPWLVLALSRRRLMFVAAGIIVVECVVRLVARPEHLGLTWFRADGLAMGAFLAAWFAGPNKGDARAATLALSLSAVAAGLVLIGVVAQRLHPSWVPSMTISEAVLLFGALVVCAVAFSGHKALGFLRTRFATYTAALSYSIYLLHRPVVDAFSILCGNASWFTTLSPSGQTIFRAVVVLAICYVVAAGTRYAIELPFLRLGQQAKVA